MNKRYSLEEMAPVIAELLSCGKKVNITVTGNSMYPLFRNRLDTVVLEKFPEYKKGDVIFYKRGNGQYVLHRILKEKNGAFVVAGDNEIKKEYPVYKENVLGRAISAVRGSRKVDFSSFIYKFYSFMWVEFFFIRKNILKILKNTCKIKSFVI